jgi:hypothetical protein
VQYRFDALPSFDGNITAAKILRLKRNFGGTVAGVSILRYLADSSEDLQTPVAVLARPTGGNFELHSDQLRLRTMISNDNWAIKFSGARESFSKYSMRGKDSSNGRTLKAADINGNIEGRLEAVWTGRPSGTILLVLQSFLDLRPPHSLIYMDIEPEWTWIEIVEGLNRVLIVYTTAGEEHYRESVGPLPVRLSEKDLLFLRKCSDHVRAQLTQMIPRLNVESIFFDRTRPLELLQIRPTPRDRPGPVEQFGVRGQRYNSVWSTRFVWGIFKLSIENGRVEYLRGSAFIREICERTASSGERFFASVNGPTCIVDCVTGFRMTHEPWNLPPVPKRDGYAFVYIPLPILRLSGQARLEVVSDGDIAIVRQ